MEKFTVGLLLGAVGGALIVANSYKMRTLVKKGQDEVKQRLDQMMDEKLKDMDKGGSVFAASGTSGEGAGSGSQSQSQASGGGSQTSGNAAEETSGASEKKKK